MLLLCFVACLLRFYACRCWAPRAQVSLSLLGPCMYETDTFSFRFACVFCLHLTFVSLFSSLRCFSVQIRPLWRHYFQNTQGIIFVVDSQDQERLQEARKELHKMLSEEELRDAVLLVFANKQDLPGACKTAEIVNALGLPSLRQRTWYIMSCCATNGEGLFEGLDWLSTQLGSA